MRRSTIEALVLLLLTLCVVLLGLLGLIALEYQRAPRYPVLDELNEETDHRLLFRHPELTDESFYLDMAADPVAIESNGWASDQLAVVRARFASPRVFSSLRQSELVAVEIATGAPVGTAQFRVSPHHADGRSIGIHVHPDHRGKGYGRSITAAAILLLRRTPGPIDIGTRVTNLGMQRIMEQLGYAPEPGVRPYDAPDGKLYDSYWYSCGPDVAPP